MKRMVLLAVALMAMPAYAALMPGDVIDDVDYVGLYGYNVLVSWDGWSQSQTVGAGIYKITTSEGKFDVFCIDLAQNVPGGVDGYLVTDLASAPSPDPTGDVPADGMGADKAYDLALLWGSYYDQNMSRSDAAAFQLAVWEIVFETGSYDLSNGAVSTTSTYGATATAWLSNLGDKPAANLLGLVYDAGGSRYQDFMIQVPAPQAVLLGSLGVGLVGWLRRRRSL